MKTQDGFTLFTREEFKDWLMNTSFTRQITLLQNHHTAKPSYSDFNSSNHFTMLNGMKNYHISIGYNTIAQQITTFPDGLIAIGHRSFDTAPAGIKGANSTGVCMENVGNFDKGMDVMTEEQKQTILFVNAIFTIRFKLAVNSDSIVYHHWFDLTTAQRLDYGGTAKAGSTKSCPGTNFFGGNTVDSAQANFIPLVQAKVNEILTPPAVNGGQVMKSWEQETGEKAIDELVTKGLINTPDSWKAKDLKNETVPLWLFFEMLKRIT